MSKVTNKLAAALLGAGTAFLVQTVLNRVWQVVVGEEPPDPNDPEVPAAVALTWAVASGVGLALTRIVLNRYSAKKWGMAAKPVKIEF